MKKAVRNGVMDGNWADLMEHRTCHLALDCQTVFKCCDSETQESKYNAEIMHNRNTVSFQVLSLTTTQSFQSKGAAS